MHFTKMLFIAIIAFTGAVLAAPTPAPAPVSIIPFPYGSRPYHTNTTTPSASADDHHHHSVPRGAQVCGKFTYYSPSVGLGSCGFQDSDGDHVVALNGIGYGSLCGQKIRITHGGTGTTMEAPVRDTCPSCVSASEEGRPVADLSPALFNALGGGDGIFHGCWEWI